MALVTIIKKNRDPISGADKGNDGQEWINLLTNIVFKCTDKGTRLWELVGSKSIISDTITTGKTIELNDVGTLTPINSGIDVNITIPPESTTNFIAGDTIRYKQFGLGEIIIVAGAGVTIDSYEDSVNSAGINAVIELEYMGSDLWTLTGLLY